MKVSDSTHVKKSKEGTSLQLIEAAQRGAIQRQMKHCTRTQATSSMGSSPRNPGSREGVEGDEHGGNDLCDETTRLQVPCLDDDTNPRSTDQQPDMYLAIISFHLDDARPGGSQRAEPNTMGRRSPDGTMAPTLAFEHAQWLLDGRGREGKGTEVGRIRVDLDVGLVAGICGALRVPHVLRALVLTICCWME